MSTFDDDGRSRSQDQVDDLQTEADRSNVVVEELRESVVALSVRVQGLSSSLDLVNEVQRVQQDIDRRALDALEEARRATATANRAENSVVPREELDARNAAEERLRRWDRKILLRKVYGTLIAALLLCMVLAAIIGHQREYQQQTRRNLESFSNVVYQSCLARNHNLNETRRLYQSLIDAERKVADPRDQPRTDARIAAYQRVIDHTGAPLDCKLYTDSIYHR